MPMSHLQSRRNRAIATAFRRAGWLCSLVLLAASAHAQSVPQPMLPTVSLNVGIHLIQAEVAANDRQRAAGLMMRRSMASNAGMLFIFDQPGTQCMWMRNTLLPLSVAFIDDDGTIVNVEDMQPQTDDSHCAKHAVRYALEMNADWFAKHGAKSGARIMGLPRR